MTRKIVHIDMDAFFAAVEQRDNPELKGQPVVVGGDPRKRGVVATASYEARQFGIRSAMSCAKAYRLCPHAVFIRSNIDRYRAVSRQIRSIFEEVTPLVEPLSLDEAYLDVTENHLKLHLARDVALYVKARIKEETGLTASAGVAPNKFLAKVASDLRKPDGLVVIAPERIETFLESLAVEKIWGVGPVTAKKLHEMGLNVVGDIRRMNSEVLERKLGKYGPFLYELSHGRDSRQVTPNREPKSRGAECTLDTDMVDIHALESIVCSQAKSVADSLHRLGKKGRTVTIKVRYSDFSTITRSRSVNRPTADSTVIAAVARDLLHSSTDAGRRPIRLVGVSVSSFEGQGGPEQLWLNLPLP